MYIGQSMAAFGMCVVAVTLSRIRARGTEPRKDADPGNP